MFQQVLNSLVSVQPVIVTRLVKFDKMYRMHRWLTIQVASVLVAAYRSEGFLLCKNHHRPTHNSNFFGLVKALQDQSRMEDQPYIPPDFTVIDDDSGSDIANHNKENTISDESSAIDDFPARDFYEESPRTKSSHRRPPPRRKKAEMEGASWMTRNHEFSKNSQDDVTAIPRSPKQGGDSNNNSFGKDDKNKSFRQDFRGTRVFVQGIPPHASWQDLKDHFKQAGTVVFASVSTDSVTGKSKQCGIVQFETTEMAKTAIAIMRNLPLDGYQLYVREDVQERDGAVLGLPKPAEGKRGPTPPTKWKCADEENAGFHLSDDEIKSIRSLIKERDFARRQRKYDVSDDIREKLKRDFAVHIDDRLKMWWISFDGKQVPDSIQNIKGEGRWGGLKPWRQIPTTLENDACVNPDLVHGLLKQRDIARREKDFSTADALLEKARCAPENDLKLRIHDESRTWRIWTDEPPPRAVRREAGDMRKSPAEQCIQIVEEHAPEKLKEVQNMLEKFPGREYSILKKLKQRYYK